MASNLMHTMGTLASEPELRYTPKGAAVVEVQVFFNDYVPTVGETALSARLTIWGERALKLVEETEKHPKKGKGLSYFFIGYLYTHSYQNKHYTRFLAIDWLFNEAPIFHGTGVIGSKVELKKVTVQNEEVSLVQVPVFFNGYIPGLRNKTFEVFITLWRQKAEWLYDMASKHKNKDDKKTQGKGMAMEFITYEYTDTFKKDGVEQSVTKLTAIDVKFPNFRGKTQKSDENQTTGDSQTVNQTQQEQTQNQKQTVSSAPETAASLEDDIMASGSEDLSAEELMADDLMADAEKMFAGLDFGDANSIPSEELEEFIKDTDL